MILTFDTTMRHLPGALRCAWLVVGVCLAGGAAAADHGDADHGPASHAAPAKAAAPAAKATMPASAAKTADVEVKPSSDPKAAGYLVREALGVDLVPNKKLTLVMKTKPSGAPANPHDAAHEAPAGDGGARKKGAAKAAAKATPAADAHGGEVHWSYSGETGPEAWSKLKPEFNLCAIGKRQSPINIEDSASLQGPAEPVQFEYRASNATVVNNGHTIQVDVQGENNITVRGSTYRLLQFHFHSPSEEQINFKRYPMVAHLVHKNAEGQLAVVAVLLEAGVANALIDKVWTYMPLEASDRVRMPQDLLNLNELLPADQRYYQFMGSLTTPPCSENVLWMVMKQPVSVSRSQIKLFTQIYPNNARPVQQLNGRTVRDAQ